MKKILILILIALLAVNVAACSSDKNSETEEPKKEEMDNEEEEPVEAIPYKTDQADVGEGTVYLLNSSGNTLDGDMWILFKDEPRLMQVGINWENMDGSSSVVVFVDGKEVAKQQVGEQGQGTIDFTDEQLTKGTHIVEFVQENDGALTYYRQAEYEVKE